MHHLTVPCLSAHDTPHFKCYVQRAAAAVPSRAVGSRLVESEGLSLWNNLHLQTTNTKRHANGT